MLLNEIQLPGWLTRKKSTSTPAQPPSDPRTDNAASTNQRLAAIQSKREATARAATDAKQAAVANPNQPNKQRFGTSWSIVDQSGQYASITNPVGQMFSGNIKIVGNDKSTPIHGKIKSVQPGSQTDKNILLITLETGESFLVSMNPESIARPLNKFAAAQTALAAASQKQAQQQQNAAQQKVAHAAREKQRQATKRAVNKAIKPDAGFEQRIQLAMQGKTESLIQQVDGEVLEEAKKKKRKSKKFKKITKYPNSYPALRFYYVGGLGHSYGNNSTDGGEGDGGDGGGGD